LEYMREWRAARHEADEPMRAHLDRLTELFMATLPEAVAKQVGREITEEAADEE